jgi:hypothetical protein
VGLFSKRDATDDVTKVRYTDPETVRRKGDLGRALILKNDKTSSFGGMSDPAFQCVLTLEITLGDEAPFEVTVRQRFLRSELELIEGDGVVAPVWVSRKDQTKVAIDVHAGPIEHGVW